MRLMKKLFSIIRRREAEDRLKIMRGVISALRHQAYTAKPLGSTELYLKMARYHERRADRIRKVIYGE